MDTDKIQSLQSEVLKIKKGLKDWEYTFFKSHQRKPTIKDIQERPKVERVYKDYNKKKKELRLLSVDLPDSQTLSQPVFYDTQSQDNAPSPGQKRRRSSQASVEYIRSPSHRLSRLKYIDHLERPKNTLDFGNTTTTTTTITTTTTTSTTSKEGTSRTTDEDSFWLGTSSTGSQPESTTNSQQPESSTSSQNTLFLDDKTKRRKKKNSALEQRLFGHLIWKPSDTLSPALKAERDPQTTTTTTTTTTMEEDAIPELIISTSETTKSLSTTIDDLTVNGLIITERELNPFRHFDPTLIHQIEDDPDCFVMPGLFSSSRARSTIMAPMMKDDLDRHHRIMEAIRLGTLGEKRQDVMDNDNEDEDLKRFMDENTDCLADPQDTDDEQVPQYRKKFTQKRQTKLHKFRYVETAPSRV